MSKLIDLTGKRFGRWTVLAMHPERYCWKGGRAALWLCRCDCGTERVVFGTSLRLGKSKSCGSLSRELARKRLTKHGMYKTRAYSCLASMLDCCFNPNNAGYCYYGGRGIAVCEDWPSFENFYADMGDPPPGMSLDRINNDDNYEPDNCRWATASGQVANRRPSKRKARRANVADITRVCSFASAGGVCSRPGGMSGAP